MSRRRSKMREKLNCRKFMELKELVSKTGQIAEKERIILALSGGRDSLFCLYFLYWLQALVPFELYLAHINHGLRAGEDAKESSFLANLAKDLGLSYQEIQVDVRAQEKKDRAGIEAAARTLRLNALCKLQEELSKDGTSTKVALAHQRDDVAESMLLQISRGTGLAGLVAMRRKDGVFIRPILSVRRSFITEYMQKRKLPWLEDSSNQSMEFCRNRLRQEVIPLWSKAVDRDLTDALYKLSQNMEDVAAFIDEQVQVADYFSDDGVFCRKEFLACSEAKQRLLLLAFSKREGYQNALQRTQLDQVLKRLQKGGGEASFDLGGGRCLRLFHGRLFFDTKKESFSHDG